jgi:hypothetical protein
MSAVPYTSGFLFRFAVFFYLILLHTVAKTPEGVVIGL